MWHGFLVESQAILMECAIRAHGRVLWMDCYSISLLFVLKPSGLLPTFFVTLLASVCLHYRKVQGFGFFRATSHHRGIKCIVSYPCI